MRRERCTAVVEQFFIETLKRGWGYFSLGQKFLQKVAFPEKSSSIQDNNISIVEKESSKLSTKMYSSLTERSC